MAAFRLPQFGSSQPTSIQDLMRQQLLWMLLLRVVLYTLLLVMNLALSDERFEVVTMPPSLLMLFILAVYLTTIGSALFLVNSSGGYRRFGFIQTIFDTLFAALLVYLTGGSASIFTSVFFFPIISGGLLIPLKGGLIGAATSTLLFGAVLVLEFLGYLPDYLLFNSILKPHTLLAGVNHFATKGLTFFLAAIISSLFGARLRSTTEALSSTRSDYDRLSLLYKQIFDNITTGIITVDGTGTITSTNNATGVITGLQIEEMVGKPLYAIFPGIDLGSDSPRNACDHVRRDKQKIRLGYAHSSIFGPQYGHSEKKVSPEEDVTIITLKDIGEIERLETQMRQAEKLAAIGMMSAGIAHDFRNSLAAISGSAQILAQEMAADRHGQPHNYELTRIILRESDRLTKTIADFLKFARPDNIDPDWFLLRPCLEDIVQMCTADPKWPKSCNIELSVEPHFRVWADETQLFTVLAHLVYNGMAFCPRGSEHILVEASYRPGANRQQLCLISVSDNGTGVDPDKREQIFEPFFTTRPDGTGLGLAIVKQTVEAHNGFITVETASLGGACFAIFLPLPEGAE